MKTRDLAPGAAVLALFAIAALLGQINFSRWDNMETFLPAIWYGHGELLHGRFPFWNPLQNLGEPLHALGIAGALYPPYTLSVAVTKLANWPAAYMLDLSAALHAAFGAVGVALLLGEAGVRRSIAFAAALSVMLSGYALVVGGIWVHVLPNLAWSVWAMWGLHRVIRQGRSRAGVIVAIVALACVVLVGHIQMGANVWLAVWLWAICLAATYGVLRARLLSFVLIALAAALLTAPAVLPTALILGDADRFTGELVSGPGFSLATMIGLLIPVTGASDGAISTTVLVTTFAGAWVVPALVLGGGVLAVQKKNAEPALARTMLVSLGVALVFVWLNLGPGAGLYALLHALPVWSHFRIPFKYFERAVPLLVLAGACALELAARQPPSARAARVVLGLCVVAGAAWLLEPSSAPLAWLSGAIALATIAAVGVLPPAGVAQILPLLVVIQSVGIFAIANAPDQFKPYALDRMKSAGLPLAGSSGRVLPLSEGPDTLSSTRPFARFYAPMLDGYASASGHRFALTSTRLQKYFPAHLSGVPLPQALPSAPALSEPFLSALNVQHLIVDHSDVRNLNAVRQTFPSAPSDSTQYARIFHLPANNERAWFATVQYPATDLNVRIALTSRATGHAATLDGRMELKLLPAARVLELDWGADRLAAHVESPAGGILVFSTAYSPEWTVSVDGRRGRVAAVNGFLAGVEVPAGASRVTLRVRRWPLYAGLASAALGLFVAFLTVRFLHAKSR